MAAAELPLGEWLAAHKAAEYEQALRAEGCESVSDLVESGLTEDHLRELGFKMLMQIHDEVILEGPEAHKDEALALVKRHMEKPFNDHENLCDVDLSVDGDYAATWFDAK